MKKSHLLAVLAVVVSFCILGRAASAQAPAARPAAGPGIALIDVSYIFKNHVRFKGRMEDMKAEVERAEQQVKNERDAIQKLAERLQDYRKGTPDYKQLEEELAKRQAELSVMVTMQKNEFLQKEAKIYHDVYQEISQVTNYYAKQNGYDIVLRFNGDQVDADRPDSVLSFINKPVVWYRDQLDITPMVLAELNRNAAAPRTADNSAAPARQTVPFKPQR